MNIDLLYDKIKNINMKGDIKSDAKQILIIQDLWKQYSKEYLANKDISEIWCNISDAYRYTDYITCYNEFISYMYYCLDRMNVNRWLYLHICINRCRDLVYKKYCSIYRWEDWNKEIEI